MPVAFILAPFTSANIVRPTLLACLYCTIPQQLVGNYHNRLAPSAPWDAHYEPMGLLLSRLRPDLPLTALDVASTGGTAWICLSASPDSCYARPTKATTETKERGVSLHATVDKNGYSGVYWIGPMTASPPAVVK